MVTCFTPAEGRRRGRRERHAVDPHGRDRHRPVDGVCERGQSATGQSRWPSSRACHTRRAWRRRTAHCPPVARRDTVAVCARWHGWSGHRLRRAQGIGRHRAAESAAIGRHLDQSHRIGLRRSNLIAIRCAVRIDRRPEARAASTRCARRRHRRPHDSRTAAVSTTPRDCTSRARADASGWSGTDDPQLPDAAHHRPRIHESAHVANVRHSHLACIGAGARAGHAHAGGHAAASCQHSRRVISRIREPHADGHRSQQLRIECEGPARQRADSAESPGQDRLARSVPDPGHAARRRTRLHVVGRSWWWRHRDRFREPRPRAVGIGRCRSGSAPS